MASKFNSDTFPFPGILSQSTMLKNVVRSFWDSVLAKVSRPLPWGEEELALHLLILDLQSNDTVGGIRDIIVEGDFLGENALR
jgi:hypothetical protein